MSKQKDRPCPRCKGTGSIEVGVLRGGVFKGSDIDCPDCNGTGEKRLDRPKLREAIFNILPPWQLDTVKWKWTDKIIALFPDYKTYISKLISDHQEAISNLRIEIEEAKKQAITQTVDYLGNHYCIMAPESMVKEIEKQALKEGK